MADDSVIIVETDIEMVEAGEQSFVAVTLSIDGVEFETSIFSIKDDLE